jgi:hypothetical protein
MTGSVIVACVVACGLLAFVRKRVTRNELISHNDVAGPVLTSIGTVLAVMMSFMVAGVWQEFDASAQTVQIEAGTLSDLHHLADALPQPSRTRLKEEVDRYIRDVVAIEWPIMRRGGESLTVHNEAYDIEATVTRILPHNAAESNVQQNAIETTQRFLDARRRRIHDNRQGIPMSLWATLMLIGSITILFSFYFRVDRPLAQYLMVVALTSVIAGTFSLIAELDYPFRGDIAVSPGAFDRAYATIHNLGLDVTPPPP